MVFSPGTGELREGTSSPVHGYQLLITNRKEKVRFSTSRHFHVTCPLAQICTFCELSPTIGMSVCRCPFTAVRESRPCPPRSFPTHSCSDQKHHWGVRVHVSSKVPFRSSTNGSLEEMVLSNRIQNAPNGSVGAKPPEGHARHARSNGGERTSWAGQKRGCTYS
jgi:hypothetical protein